MLALAAAGLVSCGGVNPPAPPTGTNPEPVSGVVTGQVQGTDPSGNALDQQAFGLTLPDGTCTGSDANGSYAGPFVQVPDGKSPCTLNAFRATLTYTPTGGTPRPYKGLACITPPDSRFKLLFLALDNGSSEWDGVCQAAD